MVVLMQEKLMLLGAIHTFQLFIRSWNDSSFWPLVFAELRRPFTCNKKKKKIAEAIEEPDRITIRAREIA